MVIMVATEKVTKETKMAVVSITPATVMRNVAGAGCDDEGGC